MAWDPITGIVDLVKTGIDKIWPDAGDKEKNAVAVFLAELQGRLTTLQAELSGNWLQRSWRPILMLICIFIVFNNYVLFPYVNLFFPGKALILNLDDNIWDLIKIGVGGYTVGRSMEKVAERWGK